MNDTVSCTVNGKYDIILPRHRKETLLDYPLHEVHLLYEPNTT